MAASVITVKVNDTTRSATVLSLKMRLFQRWTGSVTFRSLDGSWRPAVGEKFEAFEDGMRCFLGSIDDIEESRIAGGTNAGLWYRCSVVDLSARLDRRTITWVFEDMSAGDIVLSILNDQFPKPDGASGYPDMDPIGSEEDITAAAVGSSGFIEAGPTIDLITFNHETVTDALTRLATIAGKVHFVDADGNLHFQDRSAEPAPFSLSDGSDNYTGLTIRRHRSDYVNARLTELPYHTGQALFTTVGDGSSRTFTLSSMSGGTDLALFGIDDIVFVSVNSVGVDFGAPGSGAPYTWDGGLKITQDAGETVLTSGDTLDVAFHPSIFKWFYTEDDDAITAQAAIEGNSGRYELTYQTQSPPSVALADAEIAALVDTARIPATLTLMQDGHVEKPRPGMVIASSTTSPETSGSYLIQEVSATYQSGIGFRYVSTAIDGTRVGNWIDYFRDIAGRGVSASGGAAAGGGGGGSVPPAPNALAILNPAGTADTVPTVNYVDVAGVEMWNLEGTIKLDVDNPDYIAGHDIRFWLAIPGFDFLQIPGPFSPDVNDNIPFQTPNYPRDTTDIELTLTVKAENDIGALTAGGPTADVTVTAGSVSAAAGPAPNVTWAATPTVTFMPYGVDWWPVITGEIELPADVSHLQTIIVARKGPDATTPPFKLYPPVILSAPFTPDTTVAVIFNLEPISDYDSHSWDLTAYCSNEDGTQTTPVSGNTVTVTVYPPGVGTITATETGPRTNAGDHQGGVPLTKITVATTLARAVSGEPQAVTFWTSYDWGAGIGVRVTRKSVEWVPDTGGDVVLTDVIVTTKASTTVTVYAAPGDVPGDTVPAGAASDDFLLYGPGGAGGLANTSITCTLAGVNYIRRTGGHDWGWAGINGTNPTNAEVWFLRFYLSRGTWNSGAQSWDEDNTYCPLNAETNRYEWNVGDSEDETVKTARDSAGFPIAGQPFYTVASPPQAYPAPSGTHQQFAIRGKLFTRKEGDTGVDAACWTGSAPTDAVYSNDDKICIITPDVTKRGVNALDFSLSTLNLDTVRINPGTNKFEAYTPGSPAPVAFTGPDGTGGPIVQSTSAGTLAAIQGLPVWNVTGRITLHTADAVAFAHTKEIRVTLPGYPDLVLSSWTVTDLGGGDGWIPFTTVPQFQNNTGLTLTNGLKAFTLNEDAVPSASISATVTVPDADIPWGPAFDPVAITTAATPTVNYQARGTEWDFYLTGTFTAPDDDNQANTLVRVRVISPGGNTIPVGDIVAPVGGFVNGSAYSYTTDILGAVRTSGSWTVGFLPLNADNEPGLPEKQVSVTVAPATVVINSVTEVSRSADVNRGLTTDVDVSVTISGNPGGSGGVQYVTLWAQYDWGDGLGPTGHDAWKGVFPVTGNSTTVIHLTGDTRLWVTELSSTVVTVTAAVGAYYKGDPIPAGAPTNTSYTMSGPLTAPNSLVTSASLDQLSYWEIPGGWNWAPRTFSFTAPWTTNPQLKAVRMRVQKGHFAGSTWTPAPSTDVESVDRVFGGTGGTSSGGDVTITVTGNSVTATINRQWTMPAANADDRIFRVMIDAQSQNLTWTAQNCWPASGGTDGISYATSAVYLTPDPTKATIEVEPHPDPGAPLAVSATVKASSLGSGNPNYEPPIAGLDAWRVVGEITPPVDASHVLEYLVTIPGYRDTLVPRPAGGWVLNGNSKIDYSTAPEYQTDVRVPTSGTINLSAVSRNEDGVSSTAATAAIFIPAGTIHWGTAGAAPAPVVISLATVEVAYQPIGHEFRPYFKARFTAPSDSGANKFVRISQISPSGKRSILAEVVGPFTGNIEYPSASTFYTGDSLDWEAGTWTVGFLAVNADNAAATELQIPKTVAPNLITVVVGSENTSGQDTLAGGTAVTKITVTATMTSTNAPGVGGEGQTRTDWFSRNNGSTWEWLGWVKQTGGTHGLSWEVWRPWVADQTQCKVASAIGAINKTEILPGSAVISDIFNLPKIGAPGSGIITGFQFNTRSATGAAAYHDVTLQISGASISWGKPDGVQWVNPPRTGAGSDPNFFYAALTAQCYNDTGTTPAPPHPSSGNTTTDQGGLETIVHKWSEPGLVRFDDIEGWPFNPEGSTNTRMRFRLYAVSRSANDWTDGTTVTQNGTNTAGRTLQGTIDVDFGPLPTATNLQDFLKLDRIEVVSSVYLRPWVATDKGLLSKSAASTPAFTSNPPDYAAIQHKAGTEWWVFNPDAGGSWSSFNFGSTGLTPPVSLGNGSYGDNWPYDLLANGNGDPLPDDPHTNQASLIRAMQGTLTSPSANTAPLVSIVSYGNGSISSINHQVPQAEVEIVSRRQNGASNALSVSGWPRTAGYQSVPIWAQCTMDQGSASVFATGFPIATTAKQVSRYDSISCEFDVWNLSGVNPSDLGESRGGGLHGWSNGICVVGAGNFNEGSNELSSALCIDYQQQNSLKPGAAQPRFHRGIDMRQNSVITYAIVLPNAAPVVYRNGNNTGKISVLNVDISNNTLLGTAGTVFVATTSTTTSAVMSVRAPASGSAIQATGDNLTLHPNAMNSSFVMHAAKAGISVVCIDAYESGTTVPAIVGRYIIGTGGTYGAILNGSSLLSMGGRGSYSDGFNSGITTANSAAITFKATQTWTPGAQGAEIEFGTTRNGFPAANRTPHLYIRNTGDVEVMTGLTVNNSCYLKPWIATDKGLLGLSMSVAPTWSANPTTFGALAHRADSRWWFWNPSTQAWGTVDFAAVGGGGFGQFTGINVSGTTWSSIQTSGGIVAAGSLQAGPLFTFDQGSFNAGFVVHGAKIGISSMCIDGYDNTGGFVLAVPSIVGRHIIGASASGPFGAVDASVNKSTLFAFGGRGSWDNGFGSSGISTSNSCDIVFQATESWRSFAQGSEIGLRTTANGTTSRVAHLWIRNSGMVEVMTAFNAHCGLATDLGYLARSTVGQPALAPGGLYGAITHQSGSNWWYYNPQAGTWNTVNFAAIGGGGGVTQINGQTGPSVSIASGNGVSISSLNNTITVSVQGTVTFTSVTATSQIIVGAGVVINASREFIGSGVDVGMGVVEARAFNPRDGSGAQWNAVDLTFFDRDGIFHRVIGGVFVQ